MAINNTARSLLFGTKRARYPLFQTLLLDVGRVGMTLLDAKPRTGYKTHLALAEGIQRGIAGIIRAYQQWLSSRGKVGVPEQLYNTINDVLLSRGGMTHEQPNFYCLKAGSFENAVIYSIPIGYHKFAKLEGLSNFELAIEDKLSRTYGNGVNVRICYKPTRIEVDKPSVPVFKLADHWAQIAKLPTDERLAVPGVSFAGGVTLEQVRMVNDRFTGLIVADPGFGKTQLAMSMILSLAYTNSPEQLAMFICDPKADDWIPFAELPHLAAPVITEAADLLALALRLVAEMEERKQRSMNGDRSFKQRTIMLYIDELSDVFAALDRGEADELATLLQRLTQRGRSAGFIILAATQRINDLAGHAKAYSKLRVRYAGNVGSNNDAATIAGAGVQLSKLPVGAFEIHRDGSPRRLQGFFVATADNPQYTQIIAGYLGDIKQRWRGLSAHYGESSHATGDGGHTFDDFLTHLKERGITGIHKIRDAHRAYFGAGIGTDRAREIQQMIG